MPRIITDSFSYRVSFELKIVNFLGRKIFLLLTWPDLQPDLACDLCFRLAEKYPTRLPWTSMKDCTTSWQDVYLQCLDSQFFQQYQDRTINLLLHKINSTNFISQKLSDSAVILAISVSKRCTLDLSVVKAQRLYCWIFVFPTILPFQKNFHWPFCHCTCWL